MPEGSKEKNEEAFFYVVCVGSRFVCKDEY